jgi:FkbM family methyltransferase
MQLVKSAKYGLYGRPDTCDEMVMGEIDRSYKQLTIRPDDVVFDIGGNIGAFSAWAAPRCKQVIAFEPDAENCEIFRKNTERFPNVTLYEAALVGGLEQQVTFYTNDSGRNKGLHSLVVTGGRTCHVVDALNMAQMLARHQPTVIKCDTEGGEYSLLLDKPLPEYVRELAIEIHLQKIIWRNEQGPRLVEQLETQFPQIRRGGKVSPKIRAILGVYARASS